MSCPKTDKTNRLSEYSGGKHFGWSHICSDRQRDRRPVEWVKTGGSQRSSAGPQIRVPSSSPAFSIKPQLTGNNLWTWPSNSAAPTLSPWQPTSPTPPTTSDQPPVPPWPSDPQHIPHLDKANLMLHMQNYICIMYALQAHTSTGSIWSPVFTLRGQWLFFSTGSKVSNKKIQYSKCTGSVAYQYIIQKGDRWQAIRRWKAIGSCVSPYLWMHQSAAVDNWIKKETWLTSSSKKLKLPAIWRPETLMGFFGSENYLWHLHSSASRLHFN